MQRVVSPSSAAADGVSVPAGLPIAAGVAGRLEGRGGGSGGLKKRATEEGD